MENKKEIVKYQISKDGVGLKAYFEDGGFYHIHAYELTKLEDWILGMLKRMGKDKPSGKPAEKIW